MPFPAAQSLGCFGLKHVVWIGGYVSKTFIKQLTIGGFQVFEEPVTFPLAPLTLIYGPNSAGKSAILDAMLALSDLCELRSRGSRKPAPFNHRLFSIVERHWRRKSGEERKLCDELVLAARVNTSGYDWAKQSIARRNTILDQLEPRGQHYKTTMAALKPIIEQQMLDVGVCIKLRIREGGSARRSEFVVNFERLEVSIGGRKIIQMIDSAGVAAIDLTHPSLFAFKEAQLLRDLCAPHEDIFETQDGWIAFPLSEFGVNLSTNAFDQLVEVSAENLEPSIREAESAFIGVFDALMASSLKVVGQVVRIPAVPASRSVPAQTDVTYLMAVDGTVISDNTLGLHLNGTEQNQDLARDAFLVGLGKQSNDKGPRTSQRWAVKKRDKLTIDLVNRILSEYLFRSSGYFLAAKINELVPVSEAVTPRDAIAESELSRRFLVTLELRDADGRSLQFEDVGSGLGYSLPVLISLATKEVSFLQQPELHLHPALQSELADAFVVALADSEFGGKAEEGCSQIILETHSEHILLRLLRRVRQAAHADKCLDPHTIGRENLAVLYVEPKPGGTSTVKHLRLAKDGEFIDRWPSGFFEERWEELFGE